MIGNRNQMKFEASGSSGTKEYLRSARPCLISRVERLEGSEFRITPYIRLAEPDSDQVLDEGYDPHNSPLGPVYWRIVQRGDKRVYCSTYLETRDAVIKAWGTNGLACCDPITGMATARVETLLRKRVTT
jgi:hypothetical protein